MLPCLFSYSKISLLRLVCPSLDLLIPELVIHFFIKGFFQDHLSSCEQDEALVLAVSFGLGVHRVLFYGFY